MTKDLTIRPGGMVIGLHMITMANYYAN